MSFRPCKFRLGIAGIPAIGAGSSTPFRTIRIRPARSVISMLPSGRNASAYGCERPFIGTTRNCGPGIGLPLGPRLELSKILGPSGSVSRAGIGDRKSTRLNSSHLVISYAVFCLKKKIIYYLEVEYRGVLHGD